jgi:hypothetical protein
MSGWSGKKNYSIDATKLSNVLQKFLKSIIVEMN